MSQLWRKHIFDAAKRRGATFRTRADVGDMDQAIDQAFAEATGVVEASAPVPAPTPAGHRRISAKGRALIHSFEQCKLEAYPDPGSRNGEPWTIGWGSTGPDIKRGLHWTQQQADERFERDIAKYEKAVDQGCAGVATNQNQFDAMVSLCYNIGIGAFQRSTVLRKHRAGDVPGAARAFLMWNKNDGKVMKGLTRRRLAESDLYDDLMGA